MNFFKTAIPTTIGTLGAFAVENYEHLTRAGSAVIGIMTFLYLGGCIHAKRLEIKERKLEIKKLKNES